MKNVFKGDKSIRTDEARREAKEKLTKHQRHDRWRRAVSVLASVMVFVTTYAMILPTITATRVDLPDDFPVTEEAEPVSFTVNQPRLGDIVAIQDAYFAALAAAPLAEATMAETEVAADAVALVEAGAVKEAHDAIAEASAMEATVEAAPAEETAATAIMERPLADSIVMADAAQHYGLVVRADDVEEADKADEAATLTVAVLDKDGQPQYIEIQAEDENLTVLREAAQVEEEELPTLETEVQAILDTIALEDHLDEDQALILRAQAAHTLAVLAGEITEEESDVTDDAAAEADAEDAAADEAAADAIEDEANKDDVDREEAEAVDGEVIDGADGADAADAEASADADIDANTSVDDNTDIANTQDAETNLAKDTDKEDTVDDNQDAADPQSGAPSAGEADKQPAEALPLKLAKKVDGITVTAEFGRDVFPAGVQMLVHPEDSDAYAEQVADATGRTRCELKPLDIQFVVGGQEIEPDGIVQITFEADFLTEEAQSEVVHVTDDGSAEAIASNLEDGQLTLTTDSFSVYVIAYTVDFEYEGFSYSIQGGSAISLSALFEALGIERSVQDVESVEFSDPTLLWIGQAEEETTIGALKEAHELACDYSADISEETLAEIDAQTVAAGDWALISLQAFDSDETLTVTMKDGTVVVVRVTDDNDPLGLNGRTYSLLAINGVHALTRNNNAIGSMAINKSVGTDYSYSGGIDYIRQDATAWTFIYNSEKDAYQISNNGQYLSIDPNATSGNPSLTTDENAATTWIKITKDTAGNYYLGNENNAVIYDNNGTFALTTDKTNTNAAFHMCLPEDPNGSRKASQVSAADLSNGQKVVIYKKVWNYTTNEYDFFAVDVNGKLVKVWDSSDSLYWKKDNSGNYPAIEWTLTEGTNADGTPSGYLYLTQEKNGKTYYLSPRHDALNGTYAVHTITDPDDFEQLKTVSISLPGREDGSYGSRVATWDYDANTTYGLEVARNSSGAVNAGDAVTVKPLLESDEFLFAVRDPVVQRQLTTVETVDSASKGIKISMFDFEGTKEGNGRLQYMNQVIGHRDYDVGKYVPGIMSRTLGEDGFPTSIPDAKYGANRSLKEVYYPSNPSSSYYIKDKVEDANHLFLQSVYDSTGYFYYSGFDNFATLPSGSSDFVVYEQIGTPHNNGTNTDGTPKDTKAFYYYRGNFLPFNDLDTSSRVPNYYSGDAEKTPLPDGDPRKNEELYKVKGDADYFFGMILETKFQQGTNGLSDNGDPMVFEFNGDDDLWLYCDGNLLLDIGGVHDAFHGKINFRTGEITVDAQSTQTVPEGCTVRTITENGKTTRQFVTTIRKQYELACRDGGKEFPEELFTGETFKDLTTHDLKMFYMERGAGASNLELQFNLPVIKGDQFQVTKKMPETATGQPIQDKYADAAFYYKAKVTENNVERDVTRAEFLNKAKYSDGSPVIWKEQLDEHGNVVKDGSGNVVYTDIFEIKTGQTAIFPVNSKNVSYRVEEVEPEPGRSTMLDNFKISNSDEASDSSAKTTNATVQERGTVVYENRPVDELVNDLIIKKVLHGSMYDNVVAQETGSKYFEYKVYLEATSGKMVPYSLGEYYQIDGETGQYVYYDPGKTGADKRCLAEPVDGKYKYTYADGTEQLLDAPKITEHTSQNGSIGDIRPGDTIIIKGLMEGTDFIVDERIDRSHMRQREDNGEWEQNWADKYYYSRTDVEDAYVRATSENEPANLKTSGTLYAAPDDSGIKVDNNAARGTILGEKDRDAKVTVHNEVNGQVPVRKIWPANDKSFNINNLDKDAQVTMTLKRYALKKKTGTFTLNATVENPPAGYDQTYTIYSIGEDGERTVVETVRYSQMGGERTPKTKELSLPVGTYVVERSADPTGYDATHNGSDNGQSVSFEISATEGSETLTVTPGSATFHSLYEQMRGSITVTKVLDGYSGGFTNFSATYTLTDVAGKPVTDGNDQPIQWTVNYGAMQTSVDKRTASHTFSNLLSGEYRVVETIHGSSYDNNSYSIKNTSDPDPTLVTVTGNASEDPSVTFTSTYTQIQNQKKVPVKVYWMNPGNYENGHYDANNMTEIGSGEYYPGQQITISWTRNAKNNTLSYVVGKSRAKSEWTPLSSYNYDGTTTDSTGVLTVPEDGLELFVLSGWSGDPAQGSVSISTNTTGGGSGGTGGTPGNSIVNPTSVQAAQPRLLARLGARLLGSGNDSGLINIEPITNQAETPALPAENGTYYDQDNAWSMEVTLKKGEGENQFQILDGETVMGKFTQTGTNWDANLTGLPLEDADGNLYHYYIESVSEKKVPAGMVPTINTDQDGKKILYSKDDLNTDKVLSVTNELLTDTSITVVKKWEGDVTEGTSTMVLYKAVGERNNPADPAKPSQTIDVTFYATLDNTPSSAGKIDVYRVVENDEGETSETLVATLNNGNAWTKTVTLPRGETYDFTYKADGDKVTAVTKVDGQEVPAGTPASSKDIEETTRVELEATAVQVKTYTYKFYVPDGAEHPAKGEVEVRFAKNGEEPVSQTLTAPGWNAVTFTATEDDAVAYTVSANGFISKLDMPKEPVKDENTNTCSIPLTLQQAPLTMDVPISVAWDGDTPPVGTSVVVTFTNGSTTKTVTLDGTVDAIETTAWGAKPTLDRLDNNGDLITWTVTTDATSSKNNVTVSLNSPADGKIKGSASSVVVNGEVAATTMNVPINIDWGKDTPDANTKVFVTFKNGSETVSVVLDGTADDTETSPWHANKTLRRLDDTGKPITWSVSTSVEPEGGGASVSGAPASVSDSDGDGTTNAVNLTGTVDKGMTVTFRITDGYKYDGINIKNYQENNQYNKQGNDTYATVSIPQVLDSLEIKDSNNNIIGYIFQLYGPYDTSGKQHSITVKTNASQAGYVSDNNNPCVWFYGQPGNVVFDVVVGGVGQGVTVEKVTDGTLNSVNPSAQSLAKESRYATKSVRIPAPSKAPSASSTAKTFYDLATLDTAEQQGKTAFEVIKFKDLPAGAVPVATLPEGSTVAALNGSSAELEGGTAVISGNGSVQWSDLPRVDDQGRPIYYYVVEQSAQAKAESVSVKYKYVYRADGTIEKVEITNTAEPETTSLIVKKEWTDADKVNHSEDVVKYTLYRIPQTETAEYDPEEVTTATGYTGELKSTTDPAWTETISKLPKTGTVQPEGVAEPIPVTYKYYVSEETIDGYNSSTHGVTGDDGVLTVTITNEPQHAMDTDTEISIEKEWQDSTGTVNNAQHTGDSITFRVTQKRFVLRTDGNKTKFSKFVRPVKINLINGDGTTSDLSSIVYVPSGEKVTINVSGSGKVRGHGFQTSDNIEKTGSKSFTTGNVSSNLEVKLSLEDDKNAKWGTGGKTISSITNTNQPTWIYKTEAELRNNIVLDETKLTEDDIKTFDYSMSLTADKNNSIITPLEGAIGTGSGTGVWKGKVDGLPLTKATGWTTQEQPSLYFYTYEITEVKIGADTVDTTNPDAGFNGQTAKYNVKWEAGSSTGTWKITNQEKPTADFDILKVEKGNTTKTLPGASFTIQKIKGTSSTGSVQTDGVAKLSDPAITGDDGKTSFKKIESGIYEIKETKTPDGGYVITGDDAFYIKVEGTTIKLLEKEIQEEILSFKETSSTKVGNVTLGRGADGTTIQFTVENERGIALPSTGGPGTVPFAAGGAVLTGTAGVLLIRRKRRGARVH